MALNKIAVIKALLLFNKIINADIEHTANHGINSFIQSFNKYDDDDKIKLFQVFGLGRKSDGGWESVFIQLDRLTQDQKVIWENGNVDIPNSSFMLTPEENDNHLYQIGFY